MSDNQRCSFHFVFKHHQQRLRHAYCEMFENQQCIDIRFFTGTEVLGAHVLVLLSRSEYFKSVLSPGMKKIVWNIPAVIIQDILRFMYYQNTRPLDENMLMFLRVANFLGLEDLDDLKAHYPESDDISSVPIPVCLFEGEVPNEE